MFDRRLVKNFNWGLLGLTVLVAAIGLVTLYSAVTAGAVDTQRGLYVKQLIWYCVGLTVMVTAFLFNYKLLERWAYPIYGICILLLVAVLFHGKYVGGSRRWLAVGPVSVQPSEMVKLGVVVILAQYYAKFATTTGFRLRDLIRPAVFVLIPFALIVRQPDLGTAMVVLLIAGSMTVFVKVERRSFIYLVGSGTVCIPLVWFMLKGYQKQRILTFLNPDRDPLGAGYHIIQSKIAIGSGMLTGKGFLQGTQNALSFLPEQHTDFIFSVLAEEWGFVGAAGLLLVFLVMILWGLNVAYSTRDPFGIVLSVGIVAILFWQVVINIGMVMGILPVVGVTLPMISYGGSSTLTVMLGIGILLSVHMRRFMME